MLRLTHDAYTIGWICALPVELTAAMAMLDEQHEDLDKPRTDDNTYVLGRIGHHNVVLAGLPSGWTGEESAAIVAASLQSTFRSVRYGLMVGVGGGVPSDDTERDVRLGDVVVSKPGPHNGGVVQYDYGKTMEKGIFHPTGVLNMPPLGLLTALTRVQAQHDISKHEYIEHLRTLPANLNVRFSRPEQDHQYVATYDHPKGAPTCGKCNARKRKTLSARAPPVPRVFYGAIASANQVMRHGQSRDKIAKQSGALCFEMEAAGLMNKFPCIVIRGICDYADTHKNKEWQPYAAVAAAAYAKELLGAIAPDDVAKDVPIFTEFAEPTRARSNVSSSTTLGSSNPSQQAIVADNSSREPSEPAPTTHEGFYAILNKKILESPTMALGRLVLDINQPWHEYCTTVPTVHEDQIGISLQFSLREILQKCTSSKETRLVESRLATILRMPDLQQALDRASEKTYILPNAGVWLQNACGGAETRRWLEQAIKFGRTVYLVVGIHTMSNFPKTIDEFVAAVWYRPVTYSWLFGWQVDTARLVKDRHIWQPILLSRGEKKGVANDGPEFVEMHLDKTVSQEELGDKEMIHVDGSKLVL